MPASAQSILSLLPKPGDLGATIRRPYRIVALCGNKAPRDLSNTVNDRNAIRNALTASRQQQKHVSRWLQKGPKRGFGTDFSRLLSHLLATGPHPQLLLPPLYPPQTETDTTCNSFFCRRVFSLSFFLSLSLSSLIVLLARPHPQNRARKHHTTPGYRVRPT